MPIIRRVPIPTLGLPQPVVAPKPKPRRRMNDPQFYEESAQPTVAPEPQFDIERMQQRQEAPSSSDLIAEHLGRIRGIAPPPQLEPGARVRSANSELVQPSNFQGFYERLGTINQFGQEATAAVSARAAAQRLKKMQDLMAQQVAGFKTPQLQGGGGGGQSFGGGVPTNPRENFKFAQNIAGNYGWNSPQELSAWYTLGMKESGWRNTAQNPTSTAYGIGQFLNSTWAGVGMPKTSDPAMQVEAMARYIRNRYGSPSRALAFHLKNNWY